MSNCQSALHKCYFNQGISCDREEGHLGQHQKIYEAEKSDGTTYTCMHTWADGGCSSGHKPDELVECTLCGVQAMPFSGKYMTNPNLDWCHMCNYWNEQLEDRTRAVVINQTHYRDRGPAKGGGYGGRLFRYRLISDPEKVVETRNMWYQGKIPSQFEIPDNAVWEKDQP